MNLTDPIFTDPEVAREYLEPEKVLRMQDQTQGGQDREGGDTQAVLAP